MDGAGANSNKVVYGRNFEDNTWTRYGSDAIARCTQAEVVEALPEILVYLRADN
jgi:hypothetical protein